MVIAIVFPDKQLSTAGTFYLRYWRNFKQSPIINAKWTLHKTQGLVFFFSFSAAVIFAFNLGEPIAGDLPNEQLTIRSAVSPDFLDGLHSKYLHYIAKKMDMKLDIKPLSFARRLRALKNGDLDLLVGLQIPQQRSTRLIYIEPPYQELASTIFMRVQEAEQVNEYQDLNDLRIAITEKVTYFDQFDNDRKLSKIAVDSLQQKIHLLTMQRVDAFIHNKDSTQATLKAMELTNQVVTANYQPEQVRKYHFAINRTSFLGSHQKAIVSLVEQGINNGDFQRIREQHYADLVKRQQEELQSNLTVE